MAMRSDEMRLEVSCRETQGNQGNSSLATPQSSALPLCVVDTEMGQSMSMGLPLDTPLRPSAGALWAMRSLRAQSGLDRCGGGRWV